MIFNAFRVFAAAWVACSLVVPDRAAAQSALPRDTLVLSLSAARELSASANPEFLAAIWRPEAVRGDVRAARTLLYNPDVSFESRSPGNGLGSRYEAELGLEFEFAGQRGLRGLASDASLLAAQRRLTDEGRRMLADVSIAHLGLVAAEQRVLLVEEINRLNAQLHAAVEIQLAEGQVSLLEANLATIEATRARARTLEATSARSEAALHLGRLLGNDPSVFVRTTGPSDGTSFSAATVLSLEEQVRLALATRPDLQALEHEAERARQAERLTRRAALPNLRIAGLATREDPLADPEFGVAFGISLPLFNRNQGQGERRQAEIAEAEQLRRATALRVRTEVENARRVFESSRSEVELLETELLGPIRQTQGLLDTAYREGKLDLAGLLLLRNQLLDAELSYWDAWERRARAGTELENATGTILNGVSFTDGSNR